MFLTDNERKELALLLEDTDWDGKELTENYTDGKNQNRNLDPKTGFSLSTSYYVSSTHTWTTPSGTETEVRSYLTEFKLSPFPGCCGACVSSGAWVAPTARGRGIGTLFNKVRQRIARELGYGIMICTDIESNEPQQKILDNTGWESVYKWINPRTRNALEMRVVRLTDA